MAKKQSAAKPQASAKSKAKLSPKPLEDAALDQATGGAMYTFAVGGAHRRP